MAPSSAQPKFAIGPGEGTFNEHNSHRVLHIINTDTTCLGSTKYLSFIFERH